VQTTAERDLLAGCLGTDTLLAFVEQRASSLLRANVEEHVAQCGSCRRLLSALADATTAVAPAAGAIAPATRVESTPDEGLGAKALVGRYQVLARVGAGGMGVVYAAFDPELERKVALKLLRPDLGGGESQRPFETRLRREAQAMAKLAHPNVVAVHDVGCLGGRVFVAMEFIEGPTLGRWLRQAPRSRKLVLEAFTAAGRGLAAAHAAGLVHRDFKPENVLVGADGRVRVVDFGLARRPARAEAAGEAGEALRHSGGGAGAGAGGPAPVRDSLVTAAGLVLGTPAYMAPEQHGGREADAKSDQFAFSVALYEALYGERPFAGRTPAELKAEVEAGRVRPPPRGARVPGWLRRALLRGLSRSPEGRFASMGALLEALENDPWRRARRAAPALALLTGAVLFWARPRVEPPCRGSEQHLVGVWDDARRAAVFAALRGTGAPFAEVAVREVGKGLDRYASGWVAQHVEACEATRVRGEQTEELLGLRMACLAERRRELRALSDRLLEVDARGAQQAVQATSDLTELDGCADARALSSPVRPPKDAATRAEVEAARELLAEARALELAGRYTEGLGKARALGERAAALRYRPLEAEAFLMLGELADRAGDYTEAGRALEQAAWAAEAGRHDEVAVRAATSLLRVRGVRQAHYEEVESLTRRTEALLERLGASRELEGRFRLEVGRVQVERNRFADAERELARALALFEAHYGADDLHLTETLKVLGKLFSHQEKLPQARAHYERLLSIRRRALGDEHPEVAEALGVVAGVRRQSGDYAEAEALYQKALAVLERSLGPEHPKVARVLHDFAIVYEWQGRYAESIALHRRAVALAERTLGPSHPDTAIQLAGLAAVLETAGQFEEALVLLERVLSLLRQHFGEDHLRVADSLHEIALVQMRRGRLAEARSAVRQSLAIYGRVVGPDQTAHELWQTLGDIELRSGRPERALAPLEAAFRAESTSSQDPSTLALTKGLLGQALFDAKADKKRALALVREANEYLNTDARMSEESAALERWARQRGLR
jgi:eukaryotic-like serine/threonine-protein kinase